MSTKKKKSESRTKLPDGSTIREYETEETHPDGTKVITTTTLRSYDKVKTLDDGSQVVERVNTTTTTTRECQTKAREPNAIESAVHAVGGAVTAFGGYLETLGNPVAPAEARDDEQSRVTNGTSYSLRKDADDGMSMAELNQIESRLSTDSDQVALRARHSTQSRGLRTRSSRELMNSTPVSMQRPSEAQPQRATRSAGGAPSTSFFQKTHPGSRDHVYQQQQEPIHTSQYTNVYGYANMNSPGGDNHVYQQQPQLQPPQQPQQPYSTNNQCSNIYGDVNRNSPGGGNMSSPRDMHVNNPGDVRCADTTSFALYETDRCEELPTFHKVVPARQQSRGRSLIRSMTPTRTYSMSSNAKDVNRNIKLGLSSTGRSKSRSRRQRQRDRDNPHVLDPEVVAAIGVMRDRSKSPVDRRRGRSRGASRGRQMRQSQEFDRQAGQRIGDALGIDWQAGQSTPISRQATPNQQQRARSGQYTLTQQQSPSTMPSPNRMYSNSPQQYQTYPQQSNAVHRGVNNSNQFLAHNNPPLNTVPRTPAGLGAVDFDGLPLGNLANPIAWDDVSEMRPPSGMSAGARTPESALLGTPGSGRRRTRSRSRSKRSKSASRLMGQSSKSSKDTPPILPPTQVKYKQCLLPSDFAVDVTPPKIAVDRNNVIITSDKFVHFYSLLKNKWTQTTTVSLQNTHRLSLALAGDTAVIGVPYDRNAKGLMTGSAYIFERDPKNHTWYQVKKIVPKRVQEYATVGYSVDICDNVVVVGVPEIGISSTTAVTNGSMGGGSVYVYRRTDQLKWAPIGHLSPNNMADPTYHGMPLTSGFGAIVAMRANMLVVSNYHPDNSAEETSLFVYEYDASSRSKWRLIQTDLLSTEGQRRNFGSHIALTRNGEGIFVGCHSKVSPTEILYYRRKGLPDAYGNRGYELRQILTVAEKCDISDFDVDENDALILGTTDSNRAYVYQQMHDLNTMENQGWRMVAKVVNSPSLGGFGSNVGLSGDNVLVGSQRNVYSYSLEAWMAAKKKKGKQQDKQLVPSSNSSPTRSSSVGRRGFMGSMKSFRR